MEEYILKIRKINDKVILFNYVYEGDVGLDLYVV